MNRKLALWLGISAGVLLALCGLGLAGLAWVGSSFGAMPVWVKATKAPALFHVKTSATDFWFREQGFQDPHYELLFEVNDVEKFLTENQLVRGMAVKGSVDAPVKAEAATELEGFVDDQLYRSGQLWQAGGKTWVYLVAFGT